MRGVQDEDSSGVAEIERLVGPCCCCARVGVPTFGSTLISEEQVSSLTLREVI